MKDTENNQEVLFERYSNTLYVRVIKGLQEPKVDDQQAVRYNPYTGDLVTTKVLEQKPIFEHLALSKTPDIGS